MALYEHETLQYITGITAGDVAEVLAVVRQYNAKGLFRNPNSVREAIDGIERGLEIAFAQRQKPTVFPVDLFRQASHEENV